MSFDLVDFLELLGDDPDQAICLFEKIKDQMMTTSPFLIEEGTENVFTCLYSKIEKTEDPSEIFLKDLRKKLIIFAVDTLLRKFQEMNEFLNLDLSVKKNLLDKEIKNYGNFYVYFTKNPIDSKILAKKIYQKFSQNKIVGIPIKI